MTSRDFIYWLQGFFELLEPTTISEKQTEQIKQHLAMVFIHEIDPSFPEEQQEELNQAHNTTTSKSQPKSNKPFHNRDMKC